MCIKDCIANKCMKVIKKPNLTPICKEACEEFCNEQPNDRPNVQMIIPGQDHVNAQKS
ncbi:unnamed protein product [Eruca vesicaria subsp. sativa]|uniref:Uncharacterized protein n=1 Tax=Eruca vesicaria subsp. sativa TaxID=29727 RepID=A0ABC8KJ28_ERUVS|nr:unnamed protein product [Eruca vesicaria subsp. sativa]